MVSSLVEATTENKTTLSGMSGINHTAMERKYQKNGDLNCATVKAYKLAFCCGTVFTNLTSQPLSLTIIRGHKTDLHIEVLLLLCKSAMRHSSFAGYICCVVERGFGATTHTTLM